MKNNKMGGHMVSQVLTNVEAFTAAQAGTSEMQFAGVDNRAFMEFQAQDFNMQHQSPKNTVSIQSIGKGGPSDSIGPNR